MKEYTLFILLLLIVGLTALLVDRVHEAFENGSDLTAAPDTTPPADTTTPPADTTVPPADTTTPPEPLPAEPVGSSSSSQKVTLTPESEPAPVGSSSSSMMASAPVGSSSSSMRPTLSPPLSQPQQQQQAPPQRQGSLPYGNVIIINTPTTPNSNNTAYRDDIPPLPQQTEETSPTPVVAGPAAAPAPASKPLSTSKIVAATAFGAAGVGALYMFMKG